MLTEIREDLSLRFVDLLVGYRKNCAASTAPSQVRFKEFEFSLRTAQRLISNLPYEAYFARELQVTPCFWRRHFKDPGTERYKQRSFTSFHHHLN